MFDWISGLIATGGAFGVALLMLAENVFPPIPSELVMPLAGFLAARGELSLFWVMGAGTCGSVAGAAMWYWVGRRFKAERLRRLADRHGRWLGFSAIDVDRASGWFDRNGEAAVLLCRLVPGARTLISVPAGLARMPFGRFLAYSTAGTVLWNAVLTGAGYLLKANYDRVAGWIDPVSAVVLVAFGLAYAYRVATYGRRVKRQGAASSSP